jgi:hypothetical protein
MSEDVTPVVPTTPEVEPTPAPEKPTEAPATIA